MGGSRRRGLRPTRDGVAVGVFTVALIGVAMLSRDNLLHLVAAGLLALVLVALGGAIVALRGVAVERVLPEELHAGQPAHGRWRVRRSGVWPLLDLRLEETGGGGDAMVAEVARGDVVEVGATWRFARRGLHRLGAVRLSTTAPFGLLEVWAEVDLPASLWAWPRPAAPAPETPERHGRPQRAVDPDDLDHLRPYRVGDRPRDVHWPTSARVGAPMVVVRQGHAPAPVWVEVPPLEGEALEAAISAATGSVLAAVAARRPVGLRVGRSTWPPRVGDAWRRELLTALAAIGEAAP
ncbi:MAG: DUF58 domain-containing protein [Alphaproteobacteria bacterium]|nr:DUF58 domain-containing protein [Alphaproteobacteria bacterium]